MYGGDADCGDESQHHTTTVPHHATVTACCTTPFANHHALLRRQTVKCRVATCQKHKARASQFYIPAAWTSSSSWRVPRSSPPSSSAVGCGACGSWPGGTPVARGRRRRQQLRHRGAAPPAAPAAPAPWTSPGAWTTQRWASPGTVTGPAVAARVCSGRTARPGPVNLGGQYSRTVARIGTTVDH